MLEARLDKKTRKKVLCGKLECGQQLGSIVVQRGQRYVMIEPGWHQVPGGWWVVSQGAFKRWQRGQQRASNGDSNLRSTQGARQNLAGDAVFRNRRSLVRTGDPSDMYNHGDTQFQPFTTLALPTQMRCPACEELNELDPKTLDARSKSQNDTATAS